jgi:hypothetical protein
MRHHCLADFMLSHLAIPHAFVPVFYLVSYLCRFSLKYDLTNSFLGNLQCA